MAKNIVVVVEEVWQGQVMYRWRVRPTLGSRWLWLRLLTWTGIIE